MRRDRITCLPFLPCSLFPLEHHGARLEAQVHAAHADDRDEGKVAATEERVVSMRDGRHSGSTRDG